MPEPREMFAGELAPGETVLWAGQPGAGYLPGGRDRSLLGFGALCLAGALFWVYFANRAFAAWALPFFALGLFCAGRALKGLPARKRTYYAVTSRRIITLVARRDGGVDTLTAAYLRDVQNERVSYGGGGRGTIQFEVQPAEGYAPVQAGPPYGAAALPAERALPYHPAVLVFAGIANCAQVYGIYRHAKEDADR